MTYGWAIVVVIIIGSALWYLGIFNLEQSATSYEGFTRIQPLVESVVFTTDGDFAAKFVNGAGNLIIVNNISVVNHDGTQCYCIIHGSNTILAGKAFNMGGTACSADHSPGDPFLINLTIDYTMSITGMNVAKIEDGMIRGRYGGAIGDVIPADTDIQGCLGVSGYWLGNQYCLGGDDCALKPKCCGDDPAEYYKSSWDTVCCKQESSCGSFSPTHYCWVEGTTGTTGGQNNVYICDVGAWLACPAGGECTVKHSYICTQNGATWLWRTSPANDDPDRCSGNQDGWHYCSGDTAQNRNYYCSGGSCTYSVPGSSNCDTDDGCYVYGGNGCENRNYYCSGGSCPYSTSNSNADGWYCNGNTYENRNYYCSGSCTHSVIGSDSCTDCSCSCGGYNTPETIANGNCADGKDNDCDGNTDGADPDC